MVDLGMGLYTPTEWDPTGGAKGFATDTALGRFLVRIGRREDPRGPSCNCLAVTPLHRRRDCWTDRDSALELEKQGHAKVSYFDLDGPR